MIRYDNRDSGASTHLDKYGAPGFISGILRKKLCCFFFCRPRSAYSLHDMATDALGLLDHLRIPRAAILGASMGGMIAQCLALRAPERVIGLGLMMTTPGADDLPQPDKDFIKYVCVCVCVCVCVLCVNRIERVGRAYGLI